MQDDGQCGQGRGRRKPRRLALSAGRSADSSQAGRNTFAFAQGVREALASRDSSKRAARKLGLELPNPRLCGLPTFGFDAAGLLVGQQTLEPVRITGEAQH